MRNLDMIRIMPVKELVELLICYNSFCRVWFFNGDPYGSKEEAVNACIDWLNERWTSE